jgi:uncharacterized membrane protein
VAILTCQAAFTFATLGQQSFDSGEVVTATRIIHPSYGATFDAYSTIERSGPLYYTLAWGWSHMFGVGEVALRSLSAIVGLASTVFMFLAARELFSRRAAVIAAAITALNPDVFWYAQEARSYALYICLSAAAFYFFARAWKRPSRAAFAAWAIAGALAISTHYFAALAVGGEALWLIAIHRRRPRQALAATGAIAAVGLALLPLAIHQEGSGRANQFTSIPIIERGAAAVVKFMSGEVAATSGQWSTIPPVARTIGIVALALCAVAILVLAVRGRPIERRVAGVVGSIALFAWGVPVALALTGFDYVEPRNLICVLPPLLLVVAGGIDVAMRAFERRRWTRGVRLAPAIPLIGVMALMIAAIVTLPRLQRDNWRGITRLILRTPQVGIVLTEPPAASKALSYYFHEPLPKLSKAKFRSGVRASSIATISRKPPESRHRGFRLSSERLTPQHWYVAAYTAPELHRVGPRQVRHLDIVGSHSVARVDGGQPARPGPERRVVALALSGPRRAAG